MGTAQLQVEIIRITDGYGKVKVIGRRVEDTFYTTRKYSKHYFKKHKGWAIDIDVLRRTDIEQYVLLDTENHIEYYASREDFRTFGKKMQWPGHGEQVALPLENWRSYQVSP